METNLRRARIPRAGERLARQLFQDFLPQLLCFAEKFLIFEEEAVQFQRAIGREAFAQNHVADTHRIGEKGFFAKFFEGGSRIVVVHG
jgi:hypothetical protein